MKNTEITVKIETSIFRMNHWTTSINYRSSNSKLVKFSYEATTSGRVRIPIPKNKRKISLLGKPEEGLSTNMNTQRNNKSQVSIFVTQKLFHSFCKKLEKNTLFSPIVNKKKIRN